MLVYFSIGLTGFMMKSKSLLGYTNLFSPGEYEKSDKIRLKNFHQLKTKLDCSRLHVLVSNPLNLAMS